MSTELTDLRTRFRSLQMRRAVIRMATAICLGITMLCGMVVAWYSCDRLFNLSVGARIVLHFGAAATFILLIRQRVWPWFIVHESDEEMALIVEHAHRLDSPLIAALQFESPQGARWGSPRLTSAVVHQAAHLGGSLSLDEGANWHRLRQYAVPFIGALTLLIVGCVTWPAHTLAFWNRICLGSELYPTRTQMVSLTLNGQSISLNAADPLPRIRIPFGQTMPVELEGRGEIPTTGFVDVSNLQHEMLTRVKLNPIAKGATQFHGELAQLVEPVEATFQLGDAASKRVVIDVVPLPFMDVNWEIKRPSYADLSPGDDSADRGARQRSVLEGSAVRLNLICANKRLKSARLVANGTTYDLQATASHSPASDVWELPPGPPFESLRESIKYEIQVIDQDGLSLERPVVGQLRLIADRAPRISVSAVTRKVLPTAQPKIDYVATDDFGIANIRATLEISREGGESSRYELADPNPVTSTTPPASRQGRFPILLAGYSLQKGDVVQVVLHAEDWRGDQPGQRADSSSIMFSVTDLAEVLMESSEDDKKSAKQLDEILKREQSIRTEKN